MLTISTFAQTGKGTTTPHASAQLEVASTNKGFLPPRVALTSTILASPLASKVAGMVVYNTATTGDVTPGLYVNTGVVWVKQAASLNDLSDVKIESTSLYLATGSIASTGLHNTAVGNSTLISNTANYNTAVGSLSLFNNTTGASNTALGYNSLHTNSEGDYNVALGAGSLKDNTSSSNTAVGYNALYKNAGGSSNVAIGSRALNNNLTGLLNVAIGTDALISNLANENTAIGAYALWNNTSGAKNTANGYFALYSNTTGSNNTAIGVNAGRKLNNGTANETSFNSVYIGGDTKAAVDGGENEIVIGYAAEGNGSNTVTLGDTNIGETFLRGNVILGNDKRVSFPNPSGGDINMWHINNENGVLRFFREDIDGNNGEEAFILSNSYVIQSRQINPLLDNAYDLGTSVTRWKQIYAVNSTINTSDRRKKKDIIDLPKNVIKAISQLRPVAYKWKENDNGKHIGFIAQEVAQVFKDSGLNPADYFVIQYDAETDIYGLAYDEFITAILAYTQGIEKDLNTTKKDLNDLKTLLQAKGVID
jgi:hypothetical protein